MKFSFIVVTMLLATVPSFADFKLATAQQFVECYGANNLIVEIYGDRSKMSVLAAGEGIGFVDVFKELTNGTSFISYSTSVGTLYLDNHGDSFVWAESNEKWDLTCSSQL